MNDTLGSWRVERSAAKDPGTIWQRMRCVDLAFFSGESECLGRNAEKPRRRAQVQPWFDPFCLRPIDRNLVVRPQRRHPLAGPAVAMVCGQPVPVEDAGNEIVIGDEIGRCAFALTAPAPRQAQFGMNAPHPVDDEDTLGRLGVDIV